MSEARATALAQSNRSAVAGKLGAYITLTKPDVSFLVLMTTARRLLHGRARPAGLAAHGPRDLSPPC